MHPRRNTEEKKTDSKAQEATEERERERCLLEEVDTEDAVFPYPR